MEKQKTFEEWLIEYINIAWRSEYPTHKSVASALEYVLYNYREFQKKNRKENEYEREQEKNN